MWLSTLSDIYAADGPFVTVYLEAGAPDQDARKHLELRWRALAEQLGADGVDARTLKAMGERVRETTPGVVASHGLVMVAAGGEVRFAEELRGPVGGDHAHLAPLPQLGPAVRANADVSRQLVAMIDRTGAEIRVRDVQRTATHRVVGDDFPLHKVRAGGLSHRRIHNRVEEAIDRNVTRIAHEIGRLAAATRPSAIVLAGEVQARESVHRRLGAELQPLVKVTAHGGRGADDNADLESAVSAIAEEVEQSRRQELVSRLTDGLGTGMTVHGLPDVLLALRQGAVDVLLFGIEQFDNGAAAAGADTRVAIGPGPLDVAPTMPELRKFLGRTGGQLPDLTYDRADAAVVRAGASTAVRAEVVHTGEVDLSDSFGALLRFGVPAASCG